MLLDYIQLKLKFPIFDTHYYILSFVIKSGGAMGKLLKSCYFEMPFKDALASAGFKSISLAPFVCSYSHKNKR